ncbi:MAG: amidohydrolase family protein [Planctomycetota bacterium]
MAASLRVDEEPSVIDGWVVRPGASGDVTLDYGAVRLADGVVSAVEPETPRVNRFILPGFVDTHVHLPQFTVIGYEGMTLLDWLSQVVFPAESAWRDTAVAAAETDRAIRKLVSYGSTGFAAFATVHTDATRTAIETAGTLGVRAWIGLTLMERHAPKALQGDRAAMIDACESLCELAPVGGRVAHAVSPRFAVSCGAELLAEAGRVADRHAALVQTHYAEMEPEVDLVKSLFDGASYARVYDDAGLLTPRSVLAHGVWLDDDDRALLAERGVTIAHCPTANTFLRSGAMDASRARHAGVRVSLGSDIAGGSEPSMPRVARSMIETAIHRGQTPPTASDAWWRITRGNAVTLGWDDGGRIDPGCPADLVVVDPGVDGLADGPNALARLLWNWDDRWIRATLLRGRVAYAG